MTSSLDSYTIINEINYVYTYLDSEAWMAKKKDKMESSTLYCWEIRICQI